MHEKWKAIDRIFSAAAELPPGDRPGYLEEACRDDPALRKEVESLLAEHDRPGPFLGVYSSVGDEILGHYQTVGRIDEGGMGVVYKAVDNSLDREVAIKLLKPWMMGDPRARQRLRQEAKHASRLNHPNIVTVHTIGEHKGTDFIVMEYVAGQALDNRIPIRGLRLEQAIDFACQIASALAAAHAAGVIHGDLKPRNIIVTDQNRLKLIDFGVARRIGAPTETRAFATKEYAAPEQHKGILDVRSEVFTFGLLLYQMLCGQHAFDSGTRDEISAAIRTHEPNPLRPKVPAAVAEVIKRCLEKDPDRRFQSMSDVVTALETCLNWDIRPNAQEAANPGPKKPAVSISELRSELKRIGYDSLAESRRAFAAVTGHLQKSGSITARQAVIEAMRNLIVSEPETDGGVVTRVSREVRNLALELIKLAKPGDFKDCFEEKDLQYLDLYGMDFAGQRLAGMNFSGSFLVEASFRDSNLSRACFVGSCIRNVDFTKADLSDADFTDADWFNALGLTREQLARARQNTLPDCPATVAEMHTFLKNHYALPFESWSEQVRGQLRLAWNVYLKRGGLRDFVAALRSKSRP